MSPSTVAQPESGSRTGVTLETLERLLAAAGFQLDAALVPLGDDVDRAADEWAGTGLEVSVRKLPFLLGPVIRDLHRAWVDFVVSGRHGGVPLGRPAVRVLLTRPA